MADSKDNKTKADSNPRLETGVAVERSTSFEGGYGDNQSSTSDKQGKDLLTEVSLEDIERDIEHELAEEDGQPAPKDKAEGEDGEKPEPEAHDLGVYDGSEEARSKFDAKYMVPGEEGAPPQLNRDALGKEFWDGFAKAGKDAKPSGHLNEETYKFLEDTFGVDRSFINEYEEGLVLKARASETEVLSKVPGIQDALKWGREGGYTPEQVTRFNELYAKGGADREDAVEALMARYNKANPKPADGPRGPGRRASSPRRDASSGSGSGDNPARAAEGYASQGDYNKEWSAALAARSEARKTGDREAIRKSDEEVSRVSRKLRKSKF